MEPVPVRLSPEARAQLPPREAFLAAAVASLRDGVLFASYPDRVILDANDAFLRMTGYAREEVVGRTAEALHVDGERHAALAERLAAPLARGEAASFDWPLRRKDGARLDVHATATPLAPYAGSPIGVVCVLRDATEATRLAAERDRVAVQEAFLAENGVDVISRTGMDGVIRYVSPSCRRVLGYAPEEMVGRKASDFAPPEQLAEGEARQMASAPGAPVTHLQRVRHKDGRWIWMESVVRVLPDAEGRSQEFLAVARDVTARKLQEEALERSEARWRGLAESAPGYIFHVARDGTILSINRVAKGVRPEDIVGHNQYERFAPEDRERIRALQESVFRTGKPVRYEVKADTVSFGPRWYENHVGPIVERGEVVALSVLTLDVTERRVAEQERGRAQGLLEAVLSQMPSGVVVADATGRVVHANGRMDAIAGAAGRFDLPDVAAYAAWEGWRPDGSPLAPEDWPLSRALATGETVRGELVRVRNAAGADLWCRVSASPVRDADGRMVAGVAVVEDVTRERAAMAEALAQRRRLESLIDAQTEMGDAILVTVGPRIEWANDALLRLLGVTLEEVTAPGFDATRFVPPEDRAALLARGAERLSGRRLQDHYEMRVLRRDGTIVPVEVSTRGEMTPEGVRVTAMLRDVTQRKRQQAELEQARAQLARSEKLSALGSLVAGVAHELRTPLTYLATNLDLVERGVERILADLPPERRDAARGRLGPRLMDAREGMDRINRLVEDLRKFTKLREGGEWMRLDLAPIVDEAVGLYRATRRGDVTVVDELQPTPLRDLDRVQVQQVVLNLLENAREARGGVVRVRTYGDAEGRPVLEVQDDGPGIPADVQARMWDPFFTTKPEGSGLGLAIVKRIADGHGATVSCVSEAGKGTTFRLTFR